MKKFKYKEVKEFAETARTVVEEARAALDRHMAEHGC
jgi:hypothetical protein